MAVIEELRAQQRDHPELVSGSNNAIFYIGGEKSLEEKIISERGVNFYGIHTGKLRRYFDFKNFVDFLKLPIGFFEALSILRKIKPNLVFSKGGYVSVPVVFAARVLKIPVWMHESDVSPGLGSRFCGRFAQKIFLSFEESKKFFPGKQGEVVGNPIRQSLLKGSREIGLKLTGFSGNRPIILIIGGSSGALSLNKIIEKILPALLKEMNVIHITGPHDLHPSARKSPHYKSFQFVQEDLAHLYAISNLVISRAGSGSIFEFLALGLPMILIPLPKSASRGDQIENAKIFTQHGVAEWFDQDTLFPEMLLEKTRLLFHDQKMRHEMIKKQKEFSLKAAASEIAHLIAIDK